MTRPRLSPLVLTIIECNYAVLLGQLTRLWGGDRAAVMTVNVVLQLPVDMPGEDGLRAEPEYRATGEYP